MSDIDVREMEHRDGVAWWDAPVPRRFRHQHRWQTRGWVGEFGLLNIDRCACGAIRKGQGPWVMLDPWPEKRETP